MNAGQIKDNNLMCMRPSDPTGADSTLRHSDTYTAHNNINVYWYREIDSTNSAAREFILNGIRERTVIAADYQTNGKGRFEREWHSPAGKGLWFSIMQPYSFDIAAASQLTLLAAVAVSQAVQNIKGIRPGIKWPNALNINGKKVCGILTEMITDSYDDSVYLIIGIGLNVNLSTADMSESIRESATSLMIEYGSVINRRDLLDEILDRFTRWYDVWGKDGFSKVREEWLKYNVTIGRSLEINLWNDCICGEAVGMDMGGLLEIVDSNNVVQKISSGEISFIL